MASGVTLQLLFDTMPNGLIMVEQGGVIRLINSQVERLFGYSTEELLGQPIELLIPQRYHARHVPYRDAFFEKLEQRPMGAGRDLFGRRKDGTEFPVEVALTPLREAGNGVAVLCTVVDISERKKAEAYKDQLLHELDTRNSELTALYRVSELLRASENQLNVLAEVSEAVLSGLPPAATAGVRITLDGRHYTSPREVEGVDCGSAAIIVQGRQRGAIQALLAEGGESTPSFDHDHTGYFLRRVADKIGETVERLEAEAKVLHSSKLASVGELAAGIGHEINNPINGIINCAELLLKDAPAESREEKFLELIRKEAERVAGIVASLLAFSRQDKYHYSPARLQDILDGVLDLSRKRIAKSHIQLQLHLPEGLPKIMCRSEQLQQVLMNLIINAVHALDEKYPEAHENKALIISARELVVDGAPHVSVVLEDNGPGIPAENRERIFDPFFTTKGRDKGTGLGLSVSDGIVRSHGGSISLESKVGEYTRFTILLPVGRPREEMEAEAP